MNKENDKIVAVLTIVNAPYANSLDDIGLANAIAHGDIKKAQVGAFLMEVSSDLKSAFLEKHALSKDMLTKTAKAFSQWSGHEIVV